MAGYTRQSVADIINGLEVTAPPLNAEFNQVAAAFDASSGHLHDGSTGNAPKINLPTSVDGYLPADHGGVGGRNKTDATSNPTVTNDSNQGYAPGSLWLNTSTGRVFLCVGNAVGAAVWREVAQVTENDVFFPETNDTVDLGTAAERFRNLFLSGGLTMAGNASVGGSLTVTGQINADGGVAGDVTGNIVGDLSGNVSAASGGSTFNDITVNGEADFTNTPLKNVSTPTLPSHAATKNYVDTSIANLVGGAPSTLDTLNEIAAALNDDQNAFSTLDTKIDTKLDVAGDTMTGDLAMGGNIVTGLASPSNGSDAVNLTYVTNLFGSTSSAAMSAQLAEDYAEKAEDSEVEPGKFSAKHHAAKSSASASAAAASESNAASSASSASTSESNAAASASAASTSASNAATSEANAASSESNAAQSESAAATSETNAANSASAASNSESNAATSASNAATSETNAANSASAAATSASNAATSEANAADSASEAASAAASIDTEKLAGIEANADVTDTANVTAAGALMDSELTSEASVKALDQGVATTDSPDFAGVTVDEATLKAIAESKSETAVDVFVYDTSLDSDGGAWRHRCQHTSWFNEPLNTATRGGRREFPAVAVIVAESDRVTIYDGDDPSLPMWRVEDYTGLTIRALATLGGKLVIGTASGLIVSDYPADDLGTTAPNYTTATNPAIVDNEIVDVAMTVMPDAPIDEATGLPVPTIALSAYDPGVLGGLSILQNDGSVVSSVLNSRSPREIAFAGPGLYHAKGADLNPLKFIEDVRTLSDGFGDSRSWPRGVIGYSDKNFRPVLGRGVASFGISAAKPGLFHLVRGRNASEDLIARKTTTYNTGWMPGDIKGAFLSDTDDTDLVGSGELVPAGQPTSTIDATVSAGSTKEHLWSMDASPSKLIWDTGQTNPAGWYKIVAPVDGISASTEYLDIGNTAGGNEALGIRGNGGWDGTYYLSAPWRYVTYVRGDGDLTPDSEADTPSVKRADADRSVNNNGLIVNGTINREPVAPGADLVAYSGFSYDTNYLEQPYNPDLNFGAGDFCVMGWVRRNAVSASQIFFDRNDVAGVGPRVSLFRSGATEVRAVVGSTAVNGSGVDIPGDTWTQVGLLRKDGMASIFFNGEIVYTQSATDDVDNTSAVARLGVEATGGAPADKYSLSLFRISATAPTAEQIAKIYEDEKFLFQENAQATLYGTSDAVTALAPDPVTNLLHVGTSDGRSVFQGLRRVDNTTTPVNTAISAVGGMIAED